MTPLLNPLRALTICFLVLSACILMIENAAGVVTESPPLSSLSVRSILALAEKEAESVGESEAWLLQIFAAARAAVGDTAEALQTVDLIADDHSRSKALKFVARSRLDVGDTTSALQVALLMEDVLRRVDVLNDIAVVQAERGDALGAATTLAQCMLAVRESDDPSSPDCVFADVAKSRATIGDVAGALSTASLIERAYDRKETVDTIISILLKQRNFRGAFWGIEQLDDPQYRSRRLSDVAVAQAGMGDLAGAAVTLFRAMHVVDNIDDPVYRTMSLSDIAVAYATMDNTEEARATLIRAGVLAGAIGDHEDRGKAWKSIAVAHAKMGDISGALSTANASLEDPQLSSTLHAIGMSLYDMVVARVEMGDIEKALEVGRGVTFDQWARYWRMHALSAIAMAQVRAGDEEGAGKTFSEATGIAKNEDFAPMRLVMLSLVAAAQISAGYFAEGLQHAGDVGRALQSTNALVTENQSPADGSTANQSGYDYIGRGAMDQIFGSFGRMRIRDVQRAVDAALNIDAVSSRAALLAIIAVLVATTEHESV